MKDNHCTAPEANEIIRKETGQKVTKWEVYAYIRTGMLEAAKVGRWYCVSLRSLEKLITSIQKASPEEQAGVHRGTKEEK